MTTAPVEQMTSTVRANQDAAAASTNNAMDGFQELAKAYQAMASKNAEKLSDSIHQLTAVKSPTEFMSLQQQLIKEGFESAMRDSNDIAKLTAAVFTSAFQPIQNRVETMQHAAKK